MVMPTSALTCTTARPAEAEAARRQASGDVACRCSQAMLVTSSSTMAAASVT